MPSFAVKICVYSFAEKTYVFVSFMGYVLFQIAHCEKHFHSPRKRIMCMR